MHLRILLLKVNTEEIAVPSTCIYAGCDRMKFRFTQKVEVIIYLNAKLPQNTPSPRIYI
jgi:hypothetical protein